MTLLIAHASIGAALGNGTTAVSASPISFSPRHLINCRLQYFLPQAVHFGFFLHADRFRSSVSPHIACGDAVRPTRSLLYAVYLLGAHMCRSGPLFELKPVFLARALQAISTETGVPRDSTHAIQTIQAHVLLANYFFLHRALLTAQIHANTAATLALGYRLHRLGSGPLHHGDPSSFDAHLTSARDSVEEGERICCFWAVVSLQANLNLAFDSPTGLSSCILEAAGREIDTPWPMHITEYESKSGYSAADNSAGEVVERFLLDEGSIIQIPVSHVQPSVLLHRASILATKWASHLQPTELASSMNCYTWLDERITQFAEGLHPASPVASPVLTQALIAVASIKLHRPFAALETAAQMKCIAAARAIFRLLRDSNITAATSHANPVIGTICALACSVIVDEIHRTRLVWAEWADSLDV
ncbi:hypothetical protein K438DRAFT_2082498, partial [Mycena galopus ATCC 62051]